MVSIHAFRGEGDAALPGEDITLGVSIHAFRGEGDSGLKVGAQAHEVVSIHAFRGEGDRPRVHMV